MRFLGKLWAFFKRDWQVALTYRSTFVIDLAQTVAFLISLFFVGKLFSGMGTSPAMAGYGGDYFRFVFLGVVFSRFISVTSSSLNQTIRFERENTTLEAILLSATRFPTLITAKLLLDLSFITAKVAIYLSLGVFLFRADLSHANWLTVIPTFFLTAVAFLGMGMFAAGFFMLERESSPLERLLGWLSRLLAGVYFPIAVLPEWLRQVSGWLPLTYALEAVRKALLQGASMQAVGPELTVLLGASLLLFPTGLFYFRWAFDQSRRQGSLSFED